MAKSRMRANYCHDCCMSDNTPNSIVGDSDCSVQALQRVSQRTFGRRRLTRTITPIENAEARNDHFVAIINGEGLIVCGLRAFLVLRGQMMATKFGHIWPD
jgi:hypothetical protein